jgi:hypothetical protein
MLPSSDLIFEVIYLLLSENPGPDANKLTYIGPNGGPNHENDKNLRESGCRANNSSSISVCRNFPLSQAFSDKLAIDGECDECPPVLSQQQPFDPVPAVRAPNSLWCITGRENHS